MLPNVHSEIRCSNLCKVEDFLEDILAVVTWLPPGHWNKQDWAKKEYEGECPDTLSLEQAKPRSVYPTGGPNTRPRVLHQELPGFLFDMDLPSKACPWSDSASPIRYGCLDGPHWCRQKPLQGKPKWPIWSHSMYEYLCFFDCIPCHCFP